jgi:hypothetical protein
MKRNLVLAALSLVVFTISVSAQKTADFSGTWNLDLTKSTLNEREKASIQSQTLTVTQTATEITVVTATQRNAPPAGAPAGGPPGGGRGGMMGGGDGSVTYTLDGKEVKSEISGQMGSMQVSTKAKLEGGSLEITRSVTTPMGDRVSSEKWTLGADGTLSIASQRPNRDGGMDTTTKVFSKKP